MAPYNLTRYFNGDMASQRFLNSVTINQGLDEAMFDPNSGYNPNKPPGKQLETLKRCVLPSDQMGAAYEELGLCPFQVTRRTPNPEHAERNLLFCLGYSIG